MSETALRTLCSATCLVLSLSVSSICVAGGAEFEDDFERADGPVDGWTVVQGAWDIVDGAMTTTGAGQESWAWAGDPAFAVEGDMTAEFALDFGAPPGDPVGRHGGVMIYGSTPTHRGDGAISGYLIDWIDRIDDHGIRIIRYDSGVPVFLVLGTPDIAEPPLTWRIEVEGETIRVLADDVPAIEIDDDTHRAGVFGVWAYQNSTQMTFDNVFIEFTPRCVVPCMTSTALSGTAPHTVDFDASCSSAQCADISTIEWDFGDGTSSEGAQVSHTFEFEDTYVVTLSVTDADGNSESRTAVVNVFPDGGDLQDDFSNPDGPPESWTVFQGDWQVVDEELVGNAAGVEGWIWAGAPPLFFPPTFELGFDMRFLSTPADGVGRHAGVMFCASAPTWRSDAGTSGYELDWIDRNADHGLRLIRVDNGAHTFVAAGGRDLPEPPSRWRIVVGPQTIEVWGDAELLIDVVDPTHRSGHFGLWAYSNGQQVAYDNFGSERPTLTACFNVTPSLSFRVGEDATFDSSCTRSDNPIASLEWDFGDGNTATDAVVEHIFASAGSYDVTLTVETTTGESDSTTRTLSVFETPGGFEDGFDREDGPPDGWTVVQGDWRIQDEALRIATPAGSPESWIWAGSPASRFENVESLGFRLEFLNQPFDGIGRHAGVFFFAQNTSPRFAGNSGYSIDWIDRIVDQGYRISVWNGGVETPLLAGSGDTEPGEVWEIELDGDIIRLIVDGEEKATVEDGTYRSGHVGFWSYVNDQDLEIDDVVIGEPGVIENPRPRFKRGDADAGGDLQLTDGVTVFGFLFLGDDEPPCLESADADNDGIINLTDGVIVLNFLFTGGPPPAGPLECGEDTDPEGSARDIGCESYTRCP